MRKSGNGGITKHKLYVISCATLAVVSTVAVVFLIFICVQTLMGSDDYFGFFGGLIHE